MNNTRRVLLKVEDVLEKKLWLRGKAGFTSLTLKKLPGLNFLYQDIEADSIEHAFPF